MWRRSGALALARSYATYPLRQGEVLDDSSAAAHTNAWGVLDRIGPSNRSTSGANHFAG
jgi:hypothetical protein